MQCRPLQEYPYGGSDLLATINGVCGDGSAVKCAFTEVSGLGAEATPIAYPNAIENTTVGKFQGLRSLPISP